MAKASSDRERQECPAAYLGASFSGDQFSSSLLSLCSSQLGDEKKALFSSLTNHLTKNRRMRARIEVKMTCITKEMHKTTKEATNTHLQGFRSSTNTHENLKTAAGRNLDGCLCAKDTSSRAYAIGSIADVGSGGMWSGVGSVVGGRPIENAGREQEI